MKTSWTIGKVIMRTVVFLGQGICTSDSSEMVAVARDEGAEDIKTKDTTNKDVQTIAKGIRDINMIGGSEDVQTKATTSKDVEMLPTNSKDTQMKAGKTSFTHDDLIVTDKKFVNLLLDHSMSEFFETWKTDTAWETEDVRKEVFQLLILSTFNDYWRETDYTAKDHENLIHDAKRVLTYGLRTSNMYLQSVDFVRTPVDGIKFLAEKWGLTSLILDKVTGFDLNVLNSKTISNLLELHVRYAGIEKFVMMDQLVDLEYLDLICNEITTLECVSTGPMKKLMTLNLGGNPIELDEVKSYDYSLISNMKHLVILCGRLDSASDGSTCG